MTGAHLIPFAGRNATGVFRQNLLWRSGDIYVMDNHRAAAWCWAQSMPADEDHGIVHIDRHYDTLESQIDLWVAALDQGIDLSIDQYLSANYDCPGCGNQMIFRWDNYLPIYSVFRSKLKHITFATHAEGNRFKRVSSNEISPWLLLDNLDFGISGDKKRWIINLDLDYFFCSLEDKSVRFLGDDFFDALVNGIVDLHKSGKIAAITICLTATPDLTGGWMPVEPLAVRLCKALGTSFNLPP